MGEGEEEEGRKTQGEEDEAGREGGSRGPMGTDEANAAMNAEKGAPLYSATINPDLRTQTPPSPSPSRPHPPPA